MPSKKEIKIVQKGFANLEIDNREEDCVLIWYNEKGGDSNLVLISRKKLPELIKTLQSL